MIIQECLPAASRDCHAIRIKLSSDPKFVLPELICQSGDCLW